MRARSAAGFAAGFNAVLEVITRRPIWVALLGFLLILGTAAGLQRIVKDTSVEAFVPPGHPALLANQATTELFGLTDPIAIAVFSENSVFQERNLALIQQLTDAVAMLPNVRADRVASITSESSIVGDQGAILVDPYFDPDNVVAAAEQRWRAMPPHISTLVSADARGAVIMAELVDPDLAVQTYAAVQKLVASFGQPGVEIQVAGPAAVSGFLSAAIDADARLLQPVVFLIVLTFLYLAFMRAAALAGPLVVLLGAAGGALGLMAWHGVPYFAITNALPVILVAISVADAIHILSAYFERRALQPERDVRQVVVASVAVMARPITLTTLTTMAGFAGIALMSIMPPITYFAWYATLGVFLAWLFSLFVLPAVLVL
ncbi:MAG: MMPL family transporter, partial [Pseudomonadota bacterium]